MKRIVMGGFLALIIAPIVLLGISPVDRVHGVSDPLTGLGALPEPSGL